MEPHWRRPWLLVGLAVFAVLLTAQVDLPPLQRSLFWDHFWVDAIAASKLHALGQAMREGELLSITPYVNLGWNAAGDPLPMPPVFPLNLLAVWFPAAAVMVLRTTAMLACGGVAAYLYLEYVTRDRWVSFVGGLAYVSLPSVIDLNHHTGNLLFYPVPFLLLLIHRIFEERTHRREVVFVLACLLTVGAGNIHSLLMVPAIVVAYSLSVGLAFHRVPLPRAMAVSAWLGTLAVCSAGFYILPLFVNLHSISAAVAQIEAAGIPPSVSTRDVSAFLEYFQLYGLQSLWKPNEGSALLLYAPAFLYFALLGVLAFRSACFRHRPRMAVVPLALLGLGGLMILISIGFYAVPSLASQGAGVLRFQINLIPFVVVLAGFICLGAIRSCGPAGLALSAFVLLGSFAVDWLLFCVPHSPASGVPWFDVVHGVGKALPRSSNVVPVRFLEDMWLALPWLNAGLLLTTIVPFRTPRWRGLSSVGLVGAVVLALFGISLHNEIQATQQVGWETGKSTYFLDSYRTQKACIDGLVDRRDPNHRTLPVGADVFGQGRGINWKLIPEIELAAQDRQKVLFSYRETMHPFTGLLYSRFVGRFMPSRWDPPLSDRVSQNMAAINLMGVKWVVSADAPIDTPELTFKGSCYTGPPPFAAKSAEGRVYVYEMKQPLGIAFVAEDYDVVPAAKALDSVFRGNEAPWNRGIVWLERASDRPSGGGENRHPRASRATIIEETFNTMNLTVEATRAGHVVVGYVYRPWWSATVDGVPTEVQRAYGGLMAVPVPAGRSTVRLRYAPWDVYGGLALSALAFMLPSAGALALWSWARRRAVWRSRWPKVGAVAAFLGVLALVAYRWAGPCATAGAIREGDALSSAGDYKAAVACYRKALERGAPVWARLGGSYEAMEEWSGAERAYQAWARAGVRQGEAWYRLGRARYRLEHFDEALEAFEQAARLAPGDARVHEAGGLSAYAAKRYRDARQSFATWKHLQPDDPRAALWHGLASVRAGVVEVAGADLKRAEAGAGRISNRERLFLYDALLRVECGGRWSARCEGIAAAAERLDPDGRIVTPAFDAARSPNLMVRLDFDDVTREAQVTYAAGDPGPRVAIGGSARVVDGPAKGMRALMIEEGSTPTRLDLPTVHLRLDQGTFALWARLSEPRKEYGDLLLVRGDRSPRPIYLVRSGADGTFTILYNGNHVVSSVSVADTAWHHYALTWRDGAQRFFVDGREAATLSAPAVDDTSAQVSIGWLGHRDGEQWPGAVAEILTFDRSLTSREVNALFRAGSVPPA